MCFGLPVSIKNKGLQGQKQCYNQVVLFYRLWCVQLHTFYNRPNWMVEFLSALFMLFMLFRFCVNLTLLYLYTMITVLPRLFQIDFFFFVQHDWSYCE